MAAGLPLQLSDLCGLFRLHSDRDRARPAVWLSPAHKLQSPVCLSVIFRVLVALAHLVVELAADLSVHSAWWQPAGDRANLPQYHDRDGTWRSLARGGFKLSRLGHHARYTAGDGTGDLRKRQTRPSLGSFRSP